MEAETAARNGMANPPFRFNAVLPEVLLLDRDAD
jgi:hypothetical protein